jgi:uncharacterized membrane protein YcgQ (UPF0703/DUF1980 family)
MINLETAKNRPHVHWQDWFKVLILLGLGAYFTMLIITGKLTNYINIRFAWLAYIGAIGFLALGLWSVRGLLKPHHHDQHEHEHHHHTPLSSAFVECIKHRGDSPADSDLCSITAIRGRGSIRWHQSATD